METDITDYVRSLLLRITPENKDLIPQLMAGVRVCEFDFEGTNGFEVRLSDKRIRGSEKFKVILWAHCLAYHSAYLASCKNIDNFLGNPNLGIPKGDLDIASKFLDCTMEVESSCFSNLKRSVATVTGAPLSDENYQTKLDTESITSTMQYEIFSNALAFIFYHELAHIYHKHDASPGEVRKKQEFQADRTAADWLFGSKSIDTSVFSGRHFGAATVLIGLTSTLIYEKYASDKHPPDWERILPVFEPSIKNDDNPVWGYIATGLYLHLHRYGFYRENESGLRPDKKTVCRMISAIADHNARLELPSCP